MFSCFSRQAGSSCQLEKVLDRVLLAFLRLFGDIFGGNFGDILFSDLAVAATFTAVPLFTIWTVTAGRKN